MGAWKGFGNSQTAPFDIGGRIDGNWIANTVAAHNGTDKAHAMHNCHFYGDISCVTDTCPNQHTLIL